MDGTLFLIMFLIIISFHLKGYYAYKFLILEEFKTPPEGLLRFSFKARYMKHKMHSFGFFPLLMNSSFNESKKAKRTSNLFLVVFYVGIIFVIGYSLYVGKYVTQAGESASCHFSLESSVSGTPTEALDCSRLCWCGAEAIGVEVTNKRTELRSGNKNRKPILRVSHLLDLELARVFRFVTGKRDASHADKRIKEMVTYFDKRKVVE